MTFGCQPSAFAAASKPGFSSEHAAAEQLRKATLMPFFGACGSGVVIGMAVGSWAAAATIALALSRPDPAGALELAATWLTEPLPAGALDPAGELLPLPLDLHA